MSGTVNNQLPGGPSSGSKGQDRKSIQFSLTESLKVSGYPEEDAKKIAAEVAKGLKGKRKYTEEDVFEAAKIYDCKNGKNSGILVAIEGLDPNNINIDYNHEDGKGTEAIWREAISQSSQGDSSNIVKREITQRPLSPYVRTGKGTPRDVIDQPIKNEGE